VSLQQPPWMPPNRRSPQQLQCNRPVIRRPHLNRSEPRPLLYRFDKFLSNHIFLQNEKKYIYEIPLCVIPELQGDNGIGWKPSSHPWRPRNAKTEKSLAVHAWRRMVSHSRRLQSLSDRPPGFVALSRSWALFPPSPSVKVKESD
jgi:hypothetical protein